MTILCDVPNRLRMPLDHMRFQIWPALACNADESNTIPCRSLPYLMRDAIRCHQSILRGPLVD
jgi:hypothetical protein